MSNYLNLPYSVFLLFTVEMSKMRSLKTLQNITSSVLTLILELKLELIEKLGIDQYIKIQIHIQN